MAVKIRLARGGTKKRPFYRIVAADTRAPRDGRFLEKLGSYNPMLPKDHEDRFVIVEERIKYWLSVGAIPTDRLHRLLAAKGVLEARPIPKQTKQHEPSERTLERRREKEEKAKAAAEAAAQAKADASAPEAAAE